jgi:hypothetical protein
MDWVKSSFCQTEQCLEWRKSSFGGGGECLEVKDGIQVRDSKDPAGPILDFTPGAWMAFISSIR